MRIYLKIVNPAIALIVLVLCFWAATGEKEFQIAGIVAGGMHTYFFAKGLFSASAVFILGRILLEVLARRDSTMHPEPKSSELLYCIGLIGVSLSMLTGLYLHKREKAATSQTSKPMDDERNPEAITLIDHDVVPRALPLRITGQLLNSTTGGIHWEKVAITAKVFVDGRFAASCMGTLYHVAPGSKHDFAAVCMDFSFNGDRQAIRYDLSVESRRPAK